MHAYDMYDTECWDIMTDLNRRRYWEYLWIWVVCL